jgi:hypothetical protein
MTPMKLCPVNVRPLLQARVAASQTENAVINLSVPLGNISCRGLCVSPLMKQAVRVCVAHSAASDTNRLVGCCEYGNEPLVSVESSKCIDDARECRLLIGSSPCTSVMSQRSVVYTFGTVTTAQ